MTTTINVTQARQAHGRFLLHSELPQPARFHNIPSNNTEQELTVLLQDFIGTYSPTATKFTIDDDHVGRGLVCAFMRDSSEVKGVMLYCKKEKIQEYMTQQGFQCHLDIIIQCLR